LMNGARPTEDSDEVQTIKFRRSVVTLFNFHARYRPAMTMSGQSVELARAAVGAVAVDELTSVNRPVRVDHLRLLIEILEMRTVSLDIARRRKRPKKRS